MANPDSELCAILERAQRQGGWVRLGTYFRLSGPGWLQSAITLGAGSLSGSLFLGVGLSLLITGSASVITAWERTLVLGGFAIPVGKIFLVGFSLAVAVSHFWTRRQPRTLD